MRFGAAGEPVAFASQAGGICIANQAAKGEQKPAEHQKGERRRFQHSFEVSATLRDYRESLRLHSRGGSGGGACGCRRRCGDGLRPAVKGLLATVSCPVAAVQCGGCWGCCDCPGCLLANATVAGGRAGRSCPACPGARCCSSNCCCCCCPAAGLLCCCCGAAAAGGGRTPVTGCMPLANGASCGASGALQLLPPPAMATRGPAPPAAAAAPDSRPGGSAGKPRWLLPGRAAAAAAAGVGAGAGAAAPPAAPPAAGCPRVLLATPAPAALPPPRSCDGRCCCCCC